MAGPPGGTGAAMAPAPMAGAGAHGVQLTKTALEMLQKSLPGLPMGSPLHTAVLKAVTDLSKNLSKGPDDQSGMMQDLAAMARQAQSQPQQPPHSMMQPHPPMGAEPPPMAA